MRRSAETDGQEGPGRGQQAQAARTMMRGLSHSGLLNHMRSLSHRRLQSQRPLRPKKTTVHSQRYFSDLTNRMTIEAVHAQ